MGHWKKLDRAMDWLRSRNPSRADEAQTELDPEALPSMEELREEADQFPLEKGDLKAMILSAMITILPVCLLVLLVLCGIAWLLFLA